MRLAATVLHKGRVKKLRRYEIYCVRGPCRGTYAGEFTRNAQIGIKNGAGKSDTCARATSVHEALQSIQVLEFRALGKLALSREDD